MKPIFILGEARGAEEDRIESSFVGPSGVHLLRMLDDAGILTLTSDDREAIGEFYRYGKPQAIDRIWRRHADEVYRTNVLNIHPPGNDLETVCVTKKEGGMITGYPKMIPSKTRGWLHARYEPELQRLGDELLSVEPNLVLCLGNTALWAMLGTPVVGKIRGTTALSTHTVSGFKCLGTYHPAAMLRQWPLRPTIIIDMMKAKREAEFPEVRRPQRFVWIEPSVEDIRRFYNDHIVGCRLLSVDIETSGTRITCIGFSPSERLALVIPFDDERQLDGNYWPTEGDERDVWAIIRHIMRDPSIPKLFQNGLYDIAFLWRGYGIPTLGAQHDTMLLHHAMYPESLKSLGYLGSIYTDEGPWKHERKKTDTIKRDE